MSKWAARDKDGQLAFFARKPERPHALDPEGVWQDLAGSSWEWSEEYGPDPLPDLTWDDDPVEIEVIIRKKETADERQVSMLRDGIEDLKRGTDP